MKVYQLIERLEKMLAGAEIRVRNALDTKMEAEVLSTDEPRDIRGAGWIWIGLFRDTTQTYQESESTDETGNS